MGTTTILYIRIGAMEVPLHIQSGTFIFSLHISPQGKLVEIKEKKEIQETVYRHKKENIV